MAIEAPIIVRFKTSLYYLNQKALRIHGRKLHDVNLHVRSAAAYFYNCRVSLPAFTRVLTILQRESDWVLTSCWFETTIFFRQGNCWDCVNIINTPEAMMHANSTKDQQNTIPAIDRHSPAGFKPISMKSLNWDYFGLFKPQFKYGLQQKNSAYVKGYN